MRRNFEKMANASREQAVPENRVARIQAELAAKERDALEAIKEDLCQWLATVLELEITALGFLDALDSGVSLCKLATHIQQSAKTSEDDRGRTAALRVPMADIVCNTKAESGTFFARDNTANFIGWCRKLGVDESVIFESNGLVLHKDEKRVILCLLDVARFAERVGISPPQLVKMEREIDTLEARSDVSEVTAEKEEGGRGEGGMEEGGREELGPPEAKRLKPEEKAKERGGVKQKTPEPGGGRTEDEEWREEPGQQEDKSLNSDERREGVKRRTPEPERRSRRPKKETFDDKASATQRDGVGENVELSLWVQVWYWS